MSPPIWGDLATILLDWGKELSETGLLNRLRNKVPLKVAKKSISDNIIPLMITTTGTFVKALQTVFKVYGKTLTPLL
jgi:hypothetical protein